MRTFIVAATLASLGGCVMSQSQDADSDPDLDGKADGSSAILKGALDWDAPTTLAFTSDDGKPVELVYQTFELSGPADITLETTTPSAPSLDTVLYVYAPTDDRWGAYVERNDDGGAGKLSKLSAHLDAGAYRVLVRRKTATGTPSVALAASCSGDGCKRPQHGCSPTEPRTATPELFIGPDAWEQNIEAAIDSAKSSLDVQMYLFTVTGIADHLIAAQQRGVALRVLLDSTQAANNAAIQAKLDAAQIPNHLDPTTFSFAHAKYLIIDKKTAVILSGNFNALAVKTTGGGERNYGFIDRDPDDIADLQSIYEADWTGGAEPDLSCTRLVVSPINSGQRILDHVKSATATLDIEVLYLDQTDLRTEIVAASQRGVAVRILLSDPMRNPQNTAALAFFQGQGISARLFTANYLHAKMIQADGIALVGSENMSTTSWTKNREVGALIFETVPAGAVHDRYEADWAAAQ
jgi:phosphatidylserine/phosphatidylglycerophosphate/cardiolipin synthase-like enzyme